MPRLPSTFIPDTPAPTTANTSGETGLGGGDASQSLPQIINTLPSKETTFTTLNTNSESSMWPPPDYRPKVISVVLRTHDGEEKNSPYAVTPDQIVSIFSNSPCPLPFPLFSKLQHQNILFNSNKYLQSTFSFCTCRLT